MRIKTQLTIFNPMILKRNSEYLLLGLLILVSSVLSAHGDLDIRIKEKTEEISADSTNSKLYFERGFLYQQHHEFDRALGDYLRSGYLGNMDNLLNYRLAEVYLSLQEYQYALACVNQYITINSLDVKAQKLKAQILIRLKNYPQALEIYGSVIESTLDIRPEDIVEYSSIFLLFDSTDYTGSINAIDIGLNKLGDNVVSLRITKMEYLKESNQYDKVIEEYNALIRDNSRKEFWYYKKASYLFELGRLQESQIALEQAKASIAQLNQKIRSTSAIKNLNIQIETIEKRIYHEI